jgi:hypothetical protein
LTKLRNSKGLTPACFSRAARDILFCNKNVSILCLIAVSPYVFGLDDGNVDYGGTILTEEGNKLESLVKLILGIGGIAGLVMGGIQAFKQSAISPLLTWFGIGAGGFWIRIAWI